VNSAFPVADDVGPGLTQLAAAVKAAPELLVNGPDGPYHFRAFDFGERGTSLSPELLREIGNGLCASARVNYPEADVIVSPEPGGHSWAMLMAFQLGLTCHILRAPAPDIPQPGVVVSRRTAYSRSELAAPSTPAGSRAVIVDDVLSSGGTLVAVAGLLRGQGVTAVAAQVIVTRGQSYIRVQQELGIPIYALAHCA
jgi:adenine phosphoribosyltransferase